MGAISVILQTRRQIRDAKNDLRRFEYKLYKKHGRRRGKQILKEAALRADKILRREKHLSSRSAQVLCNQ